VHISSPYVCWLSLLFLFPRYFDRDRAQIVRLETLAMEDKRSESASQRQQRPLVCTGGHGTEPYEQYTQQSPDLGFSRRPQP
jgi:hypothetical protein